MIHKYTVHWKAYLPCYHERILRLAKRRLHSGKVMCTGWTRIDADSPESAKEQYHSVAPDDLIVKVE